MQDTIKKLLDDFGIEPTHVDVSVNKLLCTGDFLLNTDSYNFGNFLQRLFKRIHLVDDFRMPGIARAVFRPNIRRISIEFNPYFLWDHVLRQVAKNDNIKDAELLEIDKAMTNSFKNNGWSDDTFERWTSFLVKHSKKNSYDYKKEKLKSCLQSIYIHELLHCMWDHISSKRFNTKQIDENGNKILNMSYLENIAQDFSINQTLYFGCMTPIFMTTENKQLLYTFYTGGAPMSEKINKLTEDSIKIDDFDESFLNQPFEYYLDLIIKSSDKQKNKMLAGCTVKCDGDMYEMFKHETQQFDEFNSETTDAKRVAKNDVKRVVDDMLTNGEIDDVSELSNQHPFKINNYFVKLIEGLYKTKTVSWEYILRHYVHKALGATQSSYTMKRESRAVPDFFPGQQRLEDIDVNIVVDVSGSINFDDFNRFMNEVEAIASTVDTPMSRYIQFHHEIALDIVVPIRKIRHLGIKSTGGTALKPVLDKLKKEKNKTLTVVFTDGYIDDGYTSTEYAYPILIFASASCREYTATQLRQRQFKVIHQDGDNTWFK